MTIEINSASILVKTDKSIIEQFRMSFFNTANWFNNSATTTTRDATLDTTNYYSQFNPAEQQEEQLLREDSNTRANMNPYVKVTYAGLTVIKTLE